MQTPKHTLLSILLAVGNIAALAYLFYSLYRAVATGTAPGKLGAVHLYPAFGYFMHITACLIGIGLAAFTLRMVWRWLRPNNE